MFEWPNKDNILPILNDVFASFQQLIASPSFWYQLLVIISVFIFARWLLTPYFQKLLVRLSTISNRVPSFYQFISTLIEFSNTLVWLFLQWSAIEVYETLGWEHQLLTPVASLLSAWLLIRIVSKLVKNATISRLVAIIAWTMAILNIFNLLMPTIEFLDSMQVTIGSVKLTPLLVIKVSISLWISLWLANGLASLVERRLEQSNNVTPAMRVLGAKLTRLSLLSIAILIAVASVGIDLTALAVFGGALGVGLGFGLQKIFSNLVSGVILLMDHSIKPGDVISVGNTFGWINHLGARYASVITRDGIEHLIPNEILITERVENWSYSNNLVRLRLPVGVSYKSDLRLVIKLCIEAALATPRILSKPEPRCLLKGFGDSSVDLELRVWIDDPPNGRSNVLSEVLLGVWDRFHEHGIEIPYPQRDLHLRTMLDEAQLEKLQQGFRTGTNQASTNSKD